MGNCLDKVFRCTRTVIRDAGTACVEPRTSLAAMQSMDPWVSRHPQQPREERGLRAQALPALGGLAVGLLSHVSSIVAVTQHVKGRPVHGRVVILDCLSPNAQIASEKLLY